MSAERTPPAPLKPHAPATPRPAATVLLLRDRTDPPGVEVYVTIRNPRLRFLGGFAAFPGGAVEPADADPTVIGRCRGLAAARAERLLAASPPGPAAAVPALGYWVAACREAFEETGVLLARPLPDAAALESYRRRLGRREPAFAELLARYELTLPVHRVRYFGHWVTGAFQPVRFDTRFFLAAMPPGQTCDPAPREVEAGHWITPAAALDRHRAGDWPMVTATRVSLERLRRYASVAEALRDFPHRPNSPRVTRDALT